MVLTTPKELGSPTFDGINFFGYAAQQGSGQESSPRHKNGGTMLRGPYGGLRPATELYGSSEGSA